MKRPTLVAVAAALAAAVSAGATAAASYLTLGDGQSFHLAGTDVACVISNLGTTNTVGCGVSGKPVTLLFNKNAVVIVKGPNLNTATLLASYNWQGGQASNTAAAPTTNTGQSTTWTAASLTSAVRSEYGAKLAGRNPSEAIKTLICQVNVGGQGGTCVATIYAPANPTVVITANVTITFGTDGGIIWQATPVSCENTATGATC